jgi:hypothetical protein
MWEHQRLTNLLASTACYNIIALLLTYTRVNARFAILKAVVMKLTITGYTAVVQPKVNIFHTFNLHTCGAKLLYACTVNSRRWLVLCWFCNP